MSTSMNMEELNAYIISHEEMKDAITYAFSKKIGAEVEEHAKEMAAYILNFFGYGDRIIDNVLGSEDRDVFYMMEEEKLLKTERERILLRTTGKYWRIHYWLLNKKNIIEYAKTYKEMLETPPEEDPADIYQNGEITDEMWKRETGQVSEGTSD